jgi:hypothetical protein
LVTIPAASAQPFLQELTTFRDFMDNSTMDQLTARFGTVTNR